jgi:hypothetical protein
MGVSSAASAKTATFLFNNSLAAQEAGIPSLVSVDPLGGNGFESATVEGQTRPVFKWDGNRTPVAEQAGLLFDSSFLADPTSYTVELVFEFTEDTGSWRRIIDTTGRMADTGFYVEPADRLQVYNDVTGSSNFTTNEFHRVAMTVGNNTVKAYFDGNLELNSPTDKLNIVDPIISLFVDNNLGGPAQSEFADGRIAYLRITDGTLSDEEIADNADDPIGDGTVTPPAAVPLPAAALMFLPAAGIGLFAARRSRRKQD